MQLPSRRWHPRPADLNVRASSNGETAVIMAIGLRNEAGTAVVTEIARSGAACDWNIRRPADGYTALLLTVELEDVATARTLIQIPQVRLGWPSHGNSLAGMQLPQSRLFWR